MNLDFGEYLLLKDQEDGYWVIHKETKTEKLIPKPKFTHNQIVKTSKTHYSQKEFTRLITPVYTDKRGWIYGETYMNIYGQGGGSSHWNDEHDYEELTDPILKLYAKHIELTECIGAHKSMVKQHEEMLSKIEYSLTIINPNWKEKR
jgi:hypothetical protein